MDILLLLPTKCCSGGISAEPVACEPPSSLERQPCAPRPGSGRPSRARSASGSRRPVIYPVAQHTQLCVHNAGPRRDRVRTAEITSRAGALETRSLLHKMCALPFSTVLSLITTFIYKRTVNTPGHFTLCLRPVHCAALHSSPSTSALLYSSLLYLFATCTVLLPSRFVAFQ